MKKRVLSFIVTIVLISYIGFNYEYFERLLTGITLIDGTGKTYIAKHGVVQ